MTDPRCLDAAHRELSRRGCPPDHLAGRAAIVAQYLAVVDDTVVVVGGQLRAAGSRWRPDGPEVNGAPRTMYDPLGSGHALPFTVSRLVDDLLIAVPELPWR